LIVPRRATIAEHLTRAELEQRYRAARDPVERGHWHAIWLVAGGRTVGEAAAIVGYSVVWLRTLIRRYDAEGAAGIGDRRHANPGGTALLGAADRVALRSALGGPAPDGGLWTCRKVADWMSARLGRPVSEQRGWDALRRLGFSPQRPRPRETRADPAAQEAAQKGGWPASSSASRPPTPRPR
jgi:transposase